MKLPKVLLPVVVAVGLLGCGEGDGPDPPIESTIVAEPTTTRIPGLPAPSTTVAPLGVPSEANTGVPHGTTLGIVKNLEVTEDNAYYEGFRIDGSVKIKANGVTIKRSLINSTGLYPIEVEKGYSGLTVEDVDINGNNKASTAIIGSGYTLRRVDIHAVKDGPRVEGNDITIEDCWIHDLTRVEGGHHDAIQIRKGKNIQIRRNSLIPFNAATNDPLNAAIQIGSPLGDVPISDLVVDGNYMNGGNYTVNGGGDWVVNATYSNNKFGRDFRYGVSTALGAGSVWEDSNVFEDTGLPAK